MGNAARKGFRSGGSIVGDQIRLVQQAESEGRIFNEKRGYRKGGRVRKAEGGIVAQWRQKLNDAQNKHFGTSGVQYAMGAPSGDFEHPQARGNALVKAEGGRVLTIRLPAGTENRINRIDRKGGRVKKLLGGSIKGERGNSVTLGVRKGGAIRKKNCKSSKYGRRC